jgi:hypothetical protein
MNTLITAQKDPSENGAPAANSQDEEDPSCCTCEAQGQHKGRPLLHSSYRYWPWMSLKESVLAVLLLCMGTS